VAKEIFLSLFASSLQLLARFTFIFSLA